LRESSAERRRPAPAGPRPAPGGRRRPAAAPPLVWLAAVVFALGFVAATVPGYLARRPNVAFWRFHRERIEAWAEAPRAEGALRVVGIGGSQLGRAVPRDEQMEAFAREAVGLELDYLSLVRRGGGIDRFTPLLDPILAAEPDVVLWRATGIADSRFDAALHRAYQQPGSRPPADGWRLAFEGDGIYRHQAHVFQVALGPFGDLSKVGDPGRVLELQKEFFVCRPEQKRRRLRILGSWDPDDYDAVPPLVRATMETFLDRAARRSVRVVFVDVPMHASLETLPGPAMRRRTAQAQIDRWVGEGRAESWLFPEPLDESHYCELRHVSKRGRRVYSTWLARRLAELQQARAAP
jgi:hypothetical protein